MHRFWTAAVSSSTHLLFAFLSLTTVHTWYKGASSDTETDELGSLKQKLHVYISDSPHTWDLHIKQGILTKYSDFRSLLFFWGTKPTWNSSMWTELQFSSKTANSFAGKGLVHFSENFWNNFFCWYESWQGTSFNLSLSQKPQLQDVVIYLHWKVENCRRKKSFPKATLEADSIDKFSLRDSRNCFTGNLWGEV